MDANSTDSSTLDDGKTGSAIADANGILAESESTINLKLLGLITIIFLSTQINSRLSKCIPNHYYRAEHGLTLILGIIAGCIFDSKLSHEEINNLLYSQALMFKLMILPPVFYEYAYSVNNNQPGSFV
jgi:hypothetical protein